MPWEIRRTMQRIKRTFDRTFPIISCAFLLVLLAMSLEYLFQAFKVSFFSELNAYEQTVLLANSAFILLALASVLWIPVFVFSFIFDGNEKILCAIVSVCLFLLSLIYFTLLFLHLDSVIYTRTGWSVYTFPFPTNTILIILVVDISILFVIKRGRKLFDGLLSNKKALSLIMLACLFVSSICFVGSVFTGLRSQYYGGEIKEINDSPNIILFCTDGLDTRRLGVYGYEKDTTPNLEELHGLTIYNRAYCNAGNSRASIISMLTGKSPITTKLITAPNILQKEASFQHLPNILARLGYYNVDLNNGWWASSSKSNLRNGFHMENNQQTALANPSSWQKFSQLVPLETYLLSDSFGRHKNKILYMIGLTKNQLVNPALVDRSGEQNFWKFMNQDQLGHWADRQRMDSIKNLLSESDQPLFVRLHLLCTHLMVFGKDYFFGAGKPMSGSEYGKVQIIEEAYDKSIATADKYFGEIIDTLKKTGKFENSLVIFHSDHGQKHFNASPIDRVRHPLPLIVHLPGQKEKTIFEEPVQYLDIAPSILAYLGQPIPEWMEGDVIFGENVDKSRLSTRPIIAVTTGKTAKERRESGPPLYGVDMFSLIADDRCYIYSTISDPGGLYDISGDPYDFRPVGDPALVRRYHDMLRLELEKKDIIIGENPS